MALSGNARRMIEKLKTADEELDRRIAQITAARAEAFDGSGTAANNGMAHCSDIFRGMPCHGALPKESAETCSAKSGNGYAAPLKVAAADSKTSIRR